MFGAMTLRRRAVGRMTFTKVTQSRKALENDTQKNDFQKIEFQQNVIH